jgi:hypothetical protein
MNRGILADAIFALSGPCRVTKLEVIGQPHYNLRKDRDEDRKKYHDKEERECRLGQLADPYACDAVNHKEIEANGRSNLRHFDNQD